MVKSERPLHPEEGDGLEIFLKGLEANDIGPVICEQDVPDRVQVEFPTGEGADEFLRLGWNIGGPKIRDNILQNTLEQGGWSSQVAFWACPHGHINMAIIFDIATKDMDVLAKGMKFCNKHGEMGPAGRCGHPQ